MLRFAFCSALGGLAASFATGAFACTPSAKPAGWLDEPIEIRQDCSFGMAEDDHFHTIRGSSATRVNDGVFVQRLTFSGFCGPWEDLLVVDCSAGEILSVSGVPDPNDPVDYGAGPTTSVDHLFKPDGMMSKNDLGSLEQIRLISDKAGYEYSDDADSVIGADTKPINRYDPFCACKMNAANVTETKQ